MTKKKELLIMRFANDFLVKSVKNSTHLIPGDTMSRDIAKQYCDSPEWEVTVVDNDILQTVLGSALSKVPLPV